MVPAHSWLSWHLHLDTDDPAVTEQALLTVLGPAVDRLDPATPWFFIRYWQGGPHLRLRVAGLSEQDAAGVESELAAGLAGVNSQVVRSQRLSDTTYQAEVAGLASAGERGHTLAVEPLRPGGVYREPYQPEFDRYGGVALMAISERLFHVSSVLALQVCRARGGIGGTLSSGLQALAASIGVLPEGTDQVAFLRGVAEGWARWFSAASGGGGRGDEQVRLDSQARAAAERLRPASATLLALVDEPTPLWRPWTTSLTATIPVWQASGGNRWRPIIGSHLHMLQNRLGVGPGREEYLVAILLHLLESRVA
jgi:hypothetical protein